MKKGASVRKKWRNKQLNKEGRTYYSTGEVAKYLGVDDHTLRYWEKVIPALDPRRAPNSGARMYEAEDLRIAEQIRHLIVEKGYTLQAASMLVGHQELDRELTLRERLLSLQDRIESLNSKIKEKSGAIEP